MAKNMKKQRGGKMARPPDKQVVMKLIDTRKGQALSKTHPSSLKEGDRKGGESPLQTLTRVYNDPATGFLSHRKLYLKVREINPAIRVKDVKAFLNKQEARQINFQQKKVGYSAIIAHYPRNNFQADLLDLQKYKGVNKGFKYILVVIDVYSRFAWFIPLRTKAARVVADAFIKLFDSKEDKSFPNNQPRDLTTDSGSEFTNKTLAAILEKRDIKHFTSEPGSHNTLGLVERMNKTIRTFLRKYWAAYATKNWIDIIDKFAHNYSHTEHTTIKTTPHKAYFMKEAPFRPKPRAITQFKVGDHVRKKVEHNLFEKKSSRWSRDTYTIVKKLPRSYMLKNDKTGDELKRSVKPDSMMLVPGVEKPLKQISDSHVAAKQVREQKIDRRLRKAGVAKNTSKEPRQARKKRLPARYR